MTGRVITFYSYKGGVGRSFALANIGVILAQWGYRVLMVDWDIEAPGLNHYFTDLVGPAEAGVLDFLDDCRNGEPRSWDHYAAPVALDGDAHGLYLMPAEAQRAKDYAKLVQDLDWDRLYDDHALGARLEDLRAQWVERFDFVLIDSRTGVTDFSGLTTAQLPDVLAFMFTANEQSLGGCTAIARRALEARRKMPVDRPAIMPLPIPGRFEQREEYDRAQMWRRRFQEDLQPFFDSWVPVGTDTLKFMDLLTIPYVPRWTFGEELAVLHEPAGADGLRSPSHSVSYACETIAALIGNAFANIDLLTSSRDEFVHLARSAAPIGPQPHSALAKGPQGYFIMSCDQTEEVELIQNELAEVCVRHNLQFFIQRQGEPWIYKDLSTADGFFVIIGKSAPPIWVASILKLIRKSLVRSSGRRPVMIIMTPSAQDYLVPLVAPNIQEIILSSEIPIARQLESVIARL